MKAMITFSFAILMLIASEAFCQPEAGQFYISGGAAFSRKNLDNYTSSTSVETGFSVNPSVGYMVKPRMMAGIGMGYSRLRTEYTGNTWTFGYPQYGVHTMIIMQNTSWLSSSLFLKYLIPLENKIVFALGFDLQYDTKRFSNNLTFVNPPKPTPVPVHSPGEFYKASLSPEIQVFLTKHIGVLAKYSLFNATHSRDRKAVAKKGRTDYHFRLDPAQFTWGIFVYLGGMKE